MEPTGFPPSPNRGEQDGRDSRQKETLSLLERARAGEEAARRRVVEDNLPLVTALVRRLRPGPDDYEDYFQVGCIGLIKSVDRFDPAFGVRFSTYAVPVILGELRQFSRSRHPLGAGRSLQDLARRARRTRDELAQELGREPSAGEVSQRLGADPEDVVLALEASRPVASLEAPLIPGRDDGAALGEILAAPAPVPGDPQAVDNLVLKEALERLSPWERRLVALRWFADKPQTEVARLLGVSQAHVSRSERRILSRFRDYLDPQGSA